MLGLSPAATADHITKNIPTAILFRGEGSRPRRFRMGSTTLSLRGMSMRMRTASNMVSQAAGKVNFVRKNQRRRDEIKMYTKQQSIKTKQTVCFQTQLTVFVYICVCIQNKQARFRFWILLWHPQVVKTKHNLIKKYIYIKKKYY